MSPGRKTTESPVIIPDSPEHVSYCELIAFVVQYPIKVYLYMKLNIYIYIETAPRMSIHNVLSGDTIPGLDWFRHYP